MKAFVKVNNGTFPNLNFYLAWEAFNQMGYSVTLFEEKDIPNLDISVETPVFAGVKIFRQVIDKLGINYPPFDCYPDGIDPLYYRRNIYKSILGVERTKFHKDSKPMFVKPVLPKQFIGAVWESLLNLIPITNVPDDAEVWVSDPIKIDAEWRVYVHDREILGVKHYYGDWAAEVPADFIKNVVKTYKNPPIAYGIDIGMNEEYAFVIETNDGCNLGNYGLDAIHYGEMIVSRWFEIVSQGGCSDKLKSKLMNPMIGDLTNI